MRRRKENKIRKLLVTVILLLAIIGLGPVASWAAFDAYLKIDGIPGESTEDKHKDWITVTDLGSQTTGPVFGAAPKSSHGDITITKLIDKSTPKLFEATLDGATVARTTPAVIEVVKREGNRPLVLRIEMFKATISSAAAGSGDALVTLTETLTFSYHQIKWTYFLYDPTGAPAGTVRGGFDLDANLPLPPDPRPVSPIPQ